MDTYVGEIALFPYSVIPRGWTICNGRLLPVQQYQALFSLIGTTYGGDGRTNFRVPDLRGRVSVGMQAGGAPAYPLGFYGGQEAVTLTNANLPAHTHAFMASGADGAAGSPNGNCLARVITSPSSLVVQNLYAPHVPGTGLIEFNPAMVSATGGVSSQGPASRCDDGVAASADEDIHLHGHFPPRAGNVTVGHNNMQPFIALAYCIALEGIYPPAPDAARSDGEPKREQEPSPATPSVETE